MKRKLYIWLYPPYEHRRNAGDLRIGNKTLEVVQNFQFLGNITSNTNNSNKKCIKERIMMDNKVYYAHRQLFNSSLISSSITLLIQNTLVRPVVTHGSESRTLTMEEERELAVFERKILRKIYGLVKENELWRIRQNDKLEATIEGENIVRFIKCKKIRWFGHVERMQDTAITKKDVVWKAVRNKTKRKTKKEMAG